VLHRHGPHRSPCDRGCPAAVSLPPLTGALSDPATATNRLGVSPITPRAACCPGPALPRRRRTPPPPQGHSCEIQGHLCELGTCLQRKLSRFLYQLVQRIRKYLKNCRKFRKLQNQFCWILCDEYYNFCYSHMV
jgi:hypothetical protein